MSEILDWSGEMTGEFTRPEVRPPARASERRGELRDQEETHKPLGWLPGLPDGVRLLRYGASEKGDFLLSNGMLTQRHFDNDLGSYFIVEPDEGYLFRFNQGLNSFLPIKRFDQPEKISVEFTVGDIDEKSRLLQILRDSSLSFRL